MLFRSNFRLFNGNYKYLYLREKIDNILVIRNTKLLLLDIKIEYLNRFLSTVLDFDRLKLSILYENRYACQDSPYYYILSINTEILRNINGIFAINLVDKINHHKMDMRL